MIVGELLYLISAICLILALRGLSSASTAQHGNIFGIAGISLAIITTLFSCDMNQFGLIFSALLIGGIIGTIIAKNIHMTALPQLVAAFHSLVGLAAVLVAATTLYIPQAFGIGKIGSIPLASLIELGIGTIIGAITFTGSLIAFAKLQGIFKSKFFALKYQSIVNAALGIICVTSLCLFVGTETHAIFWLMTCVSLILGILLIAPIGGSDMPVVVSMLNSYSGWTAAATGFTLNNYLLIITGALVGSSGAILSYIMCKNMNRTILNVLLGGFGNHSAASHNNTANNAPVKVSSPEDAAFILNNAGSVIIVPGYGMAVAQAQHILCEMGDLLRSKGIRVRYAIHPVAGRMPGHMNVLLAEAKVPYDDVFELDDINNEFVSTDVAFVIGANDITNPAAHNDPSSPIYGMPVLNVEKASIVLFVKRSLGTGYAGVDNELFYRDNTMMVLGDAKKVCENLVKTLHSLRK